MPKTNAQHIESLKQPAMCELLPIRDCLDNVIVRTDGCFVAAMRLGGSLSYFADDDELNKAKLGLDAQIRAQPDESLRVQYRYEIAENSGGILDAYARARRTDNTDAIRLDEQREQLYREKEKHGDFITRSLYVYYIWSPIKHRATIARQGGKSARVAPFRHKGPRNLKNLWGLANEFSGRHQASVLREEHESNLRTFESILRGFMTSLRSADLSPERLTHQALFTEIARQIDPLGLGHARLASTSKLDLVERYVSARERLATTSILGETSEYVNVGGLLWSVVTLKELPDQTSPSMLRELLTLGFPMSISVHLVVPDQQKALATFKSKNKRMISSLTDSKGNARVDPEANETGKQIAALMADMVSSSQKTVRMSLSICVRTSHIAYSSVEHEAAERELASRKMEIMQVIGRIDGAAAYPESQTNRRFFINQLGGCADYDRREKTLLSSNVADFLPLEMPWAGTPRSPLMIWETPYRQALPYSPYDAQYSNANGLVCAGSGTGKSVVVGKMLLTAWRAGGKISILERGNSYKHAVDFMGGQMIEVSLDSNAVINPFDLDPGEVDPSPEHISYLRVLTRFMIGDSGGDDSEILDTLIAEAIAATYKRVKGTDNPIPTFIELRAELEYFSSKMPAVEDLAKKCAYKLERWTDKGQYARLLDRNTTVDMRTPCLYFDISKLKDDPTLEQVMSLIIANATSRRSSGQDGDRSWVILDECWSLLDSALAVQVEQLFRTARKRNASVIGISQSIEDFTGTEEEPKKIGGYILTTISFVMLGRQDGSLRPLQKYLQLNDATTSYVSGLGRTEKGVKSQFLLYQNKTAHPIYVVPTGTELWIMSSYPREIAYRKWFLSKYKGLQAHDLFDQLRGSYQLDTDYRAQFLTKYKETKLQSLYEILGDLFPNGLASLDELPEEFSGEIQRFGKEQSTSGARAAKEAVTA